MFRSRGVPMLRLALGVAFSLGLGLALGPATPGRAESVARLAPLRAIEPGGESLPPERVPVVTGLALGPGGTQLVTSGDDHLVRIWSLADGSLAQRLAGHADWVRAVRFGPQGRLLATAGDDRRIRIWQLDGAPAEDGRPPRISVASPDQVIHALAFRPDGRMLAAAGFGGQVRLMDTQSGQTIRMLDAPSTDVRTLAFSPDGSQLATAGRNGTIRVWSTDDGRQLTDLVGHTQRVRALVYVATVDASGQEQVALVSGGDDRQVRIWNTTAGTSEALPPRPAKILALGVCPPGRLAVGGSDNLIRVWDLATRSEVCVLVGHTGSVAELVWNAADQTLVSSGFDTTVRVWRLPEGSSQQHVSRHANAQERTK